MRAGGLLAAVCARAEAAGAVLQLRQDVQLNVARPLQAKGQSPTQPLGVLPVTRCQRSTVQLQRACARMCESSMLRRVLNLIRAVSDSESRGLRCVRKQHQQTPCEHAAAGRPTKRFLTTGAAGRKCMKSLLNRASLIAAANAAAHFCERRRSALYLQLRGDIAAGDSCACLVLKSMSVWLPAAYRECLLEAAIAAAGHQRHTYWRAGSTHADLSYHHCAWLSCEIILSTHYTLPKLHHRPRMHVQASNAHDCNLVCPTSHTLGDPHHQHARAGAPSK